jgi:hypothetical protein
MSRERTAGFPSVTRAHCWVSMRPCLQNKHRFPLISCCKTPELCDAYERAPPAPLRFPRHKEGYWYNHSRRVLLQAVAEKLADTPLQGHQLTRVPHLGLWENMHPVPRRSSGGGRRHYGLRNACRPINRQSLSVLEHSPAFAISALQLFQLLRSEVLTGIDAY